MLCPRSSAQKGMWPNAWVLASALCMALPVTAAQTVLAWLGDLFPDRQWERHSNEAARYFLSPYITVPASECAADQQLPAEITCAPLPGLELMPLASANEHDSAFSYARHSKTVG